jgi:hypothetical protein
MDDPDIDADRDGVPNVIDADDQPPPVFGAPTAEAWDQDGDGIPDSIDASVDVGAGPEPAQLDARFSPEELEMLSAIGDPEQRAMTELQIRKERESLMSGTLTNIGNMKHESLKGIANNLRG